jgi:ATP synthase protein I
MSGDSGSSLGQAYRRAGPYLSLGIEFIAAILLCLFAGRWLDGKLDTAPLLMLFGAFFGMVVGFINLYKTSIRLQERDSERKKGRE